VKRCTGKRPIEAMKKAAASAGVPRSRASVTCGVNLRVSGGMPARRAMLSCSACSAVSCGVGRTSATSARGLPPPNTSSASSVTSMLRGRTPSSPWAKSSAVRPSISPAKRKVTW